MKNSLEEIKNRFHTTKEKTLMLGKIEGGRTRG